MARLLRERLRGIGIVDVQLTDACFLIARLPASAGRSDAVGSDVIGFLAHLDTTEDFNGADVRPQVHVDWDGAPIRLGEHWALDPAEHAGLLPYRGQTIITASGDTLLGADDKAGMAEIVTAAAYLQDHPEIAHGPLELIFTPDEENGMGMRCFPHERSQARYCYTIDGGAEGGIEAECFNAYVVEVRFEGYSIHPGTARGTMVNPIGMAATLLGFVPQSESPEATDGRYGFYCPTEIEGDLGSARLTFLIRDFDRDAAQRAHRGAARRGRRAGACLPGGRVRLKVAQQYLNMHAGLQEPPQLLEYARQAVRDSGIEPRMLAIRGGTDGAQLTEMGIPTPNIFSGACNMHGRFEWVALPAMVRAVQVIVNLARLWGAHPSDRVSEDGG